jgi:hypothetical protein
LTQKGEVEATYSLFVGACADAFLHPYGKGPSPIDTRIVAAAHVLGIPVLTDDRDMIALAKEFAVKHVTSLGVMKRMLDANHINDDKVDQVVQQWSYENDTPHRDWKREFKKLFGREAPADY